MKPDIVPVGEALRQSAVELLQAAMERAQRGDVFGVVLFEEMAGGKYTITSSMSLDNATKCGLLMMAIHDTLERARNA